MTPDTANISVREYDEALYVENGSIVPRSGTVKTTSGELLFGVKPIGGRDTDLYAIDTVTGELHGFMPKPPSKKTMQHSSELAESHRPLTVTDEVNTAQTEKHAFKDAIIPERKSNLPLPKPMSLDDFATLIAPRHLSAPYAVCGYGTAVYPLGTQIPNGIESTLRRPIGSNDPYRNPDSWKDNTVGPVTLASGYGSNTFPYSAAHVLNPTTMPDTTRVVTDTRKCEPNTLDTFSVPPKPTHFTGSTSHVLTETNKDVPKIPSFTGSDLRELSNPNKEDTKILHFTLNTAICTYVWRKY